MIALVHHPEDKVRLGDLLQSNFAKPTWQRFQAAVAFAKLSGTKHFCPHLEQFLREGTATLSIGIDHRGTSAEALNDLLQSLGSAGEAYIFHNEAVSSFHPKVYLFTNQDAAECLIGSGNLTEGGLFTNCELFAHLQLDQSDRADSNLLAGIKQILDRWSDLALPTVRRLTSELIKQMNESGLVPTEAQMRAIETKTKPPRTVLQDRTSSEALFGTLKINPAPRTGRKTVSARKIRSATGRKRSATVVRGFVMTLQRTDVGVGQVTAGTSKRSPEIFIPLAARDANSAFWGWQSKFTQDPGKPGKWDRRGVRVRLGTEIIEVNMMTWPDKHDFRLRNAALRDAGVVDDVLRIEQAPHNSPYDYYAEVVPQGSSDYRKYRSMCANAVRNSNKRWGYY